MLAARFIPRSPRQATFTSIAIILTLWFLTTHYRSSAVRSLRHSTFNDDGESRHEIAARCKAHGFAPTAAAHEKRLYDLFLLSTELDWLEIRLNSLYDSVDYFVIVESDKTFTGLPKSLHLKDNWDKFAAFHSKIIYVVVEDTVVSRITWDHEDHFRDALLYQAVPQVAGTGKEPQIGDALMVSDIDEVPRPETMRLLRYCDFPDRLTLRSHFYYYSYQFLHRGEQWAHPQATTYRGLDRTISPTNLRNGDGGPGYRLLRPLVRWWQKADLFDAAWHCSSCFATVRAMQVKMSSFSHTVWNTEENRNPKAIIERVRNGLDLFNRTDQIYDKIEENADVPQYILNNWQSYRYLLNRDDEDAAFSDVTEYLAG